MGKERQLIDKEKVYERACAGCIRHGEAPGECYHDEPCERLIFAFTVAEPVDAIEIPDRKLMKAIKLLMKQYEHSKQSDYVYDPIAHAFYHTWKQLDEKRQRGKKEVKE